ncbi:hypothetical protein O3M35_009458 [Rhynocoris fuscipes]|uniref:Alpha-2-macroglobulin receptor-associated protein n=1 Tax=Rhynocoris fuscipes TaxID=488301 RepID=A0AAW1D2Z4_9HEMI
MLRLKLELIYLILIFSTFVFAGKYSKSANEQFKKSEEYKKYEYKQKYKPKYEDHPPKSKHDVKYHNEPQKPSEVSPHFDDQSPKTKFFDEPEADIRRINKPFRMAKLNLLWTKAQSRLTEPKLKSLFSELKVHDKEEIAWKRLRAEGKDKDGLKEADMRRKLIGIMSTYGLLEHFEEAHDEVKLKDHEPMSGSKTDSYLNKSLFKDKKLNKLWEKAENSGFTAEELQVLKEEFLHHQEKVDQYYNILNDVEQGDPNTAKNSVDEKLDRFNEINQLEEDDKVTKDYLAKVNQLRDKHREIRDDYDRLYRMSMSGPNNQEFVEPKVQGLWKLAVAANFTPDELESIKAELFHYEKRLLKLRRLHIDAAMEEEQRKSKGLDKIENVELMDDLIKKHTRKVAKIHLDIESRILGKHTEL